MLSGAEYGDLEFKPDKGTKCHVYSGTLEAFEAKFGSKANVTFVDDLYSLDTSETEHGSISVIDPKDLYIA